MNRNEFIQKLLDTGKWSEEQIKLGLRANFHCEYCGLDFLASPDNYKLWEVDHVIPQSAGGKDIFKNKAIACLVCNTKLKNRWNPSATPGKNPTRNELITAIKDYVEAKRISVGSEVDNTKKLYSSYLGHKNS